MPYQLTHSNTNFPVRTFPLKIICDGLQSPANIGSLFRISEAFGVSEIIFCNAEINFKSSRLRKTARNTEKKVQYRISENISEEISLLKKEDYNLIALELTDESVSLEKIKIGAGEKIALVIGNEQHGISNNILNLVSQCVHIPMFGENSSLNVTQATGIALFTLTKLLK
tara:strand:+ start:2669 stop:3178 length:510 start_codon:yes stop_codon:yes gene_type:complete